MASQTEKQTGKTGEFLRNVGTVAVVLGAVALGAEMFQ